MWIFSQWHWTKYLKGKCFENGQILPLWWCRLYFSNLWHKTVGFVTLDAQNNRAVVQYISQLWVSFRHKDGIERQAGWGRFVVFIEPETQEVNSFVNGRVREWRYEISCGNFNPRKFENCAHNHRHVRDNAASNESFHFSRKIRWK